MRIGKQRAIQQTLINGAVVYCLASLTKVLQRQLKAFIGKGLYQIVDYPNRIIV